MNDNSPSIEMREQAEAWYARLMASDCSLQDRDAFEEWHSRPGRAEAYAAVERLLASVDALADSDPRMESLMQRARRRPTLARRPRRWRAWATAACAVLVVTLGLRFGSTLLSEPEAVQYATTGQGRTIALADGSRVQLDVASRIAVSLGKKRRSVELLQGRAVFDAAHDAARPFVVQAEDATVTAVGTRFQVQCESGGVVVTLAEGVVAVSRTDAQDGSQYVARLRPGEQLGWSSQSTAWTLRPVDTKAALSWTRGRLIFRGAHLADVVAEVNRYSTRKLVLADPSLADFPVHGNFLAGDAGAVVAALKAVLPVRVDDTGRELRLYRR